ncbi:DUF748 domain-containing protein [Phycisphaera mikurensis]|uniref:AsmA domain-containing protein n=1 Tax=Phycisphaera mikurensis (strain NBRC 102666 / KCTC 22515 / FYK2301M01) TaxID=1142394 RepID=I0IIB1_PHYMF|nr:hypothetical protein [Phycisphaera mikurensis]MBB6442438.1 hypothetical protein [Phycisphaera mikurensis]BAM04999.1 hypothetical protein PSMK_28400 [Phycisphaera mikurensis NBRC 102666]
MKWILRLAVVLVILAVAVLGAGYFFLNQIVQRVVVDAGTEATGTRTTLAGVGLSPFSGEASLTGFGVANPEGFGGGDVMSFTNADVQVDPASLLTDVIQVPRFHVDGTTIHIAYADGRANFLELYKHVLGDATGVPEEPAPDEPADGAAATKVVIGDLRVTNTRLLGSVQLPGSETPLEVDLVLPPVEMENIGSDGSGVTAKEAMRLVMEAVLANARDEAIKLPDLEGVARAYLDGVLEEKLGADLKGLEAQAKGKKAELEAAVEDNRAKLDAVVDENKARLEEGKQQLEGLKEGFGGLFGGKKDEPTAE